PRVAELDMWGRLLHSLTKVTIQLAADRWGDITTPQALALPWFGDPVYGDYAQLGWKARTSRVVHEGWLLWADALWFIEPDAHGRPAFASSPLEPPSAASIDANFWASTDRPRLEDMIGPGVRHAWSKIWRQLPLGLKRKLERASDFYWPSEDKAGTHPVRAAHLRPFHISASSLPFPWHILTIVGLPIQQVTARQVRLSLQRISPVLPTWVQLPDLTRQQAEEWWTSVWTDLHNAKLPLALLSSVWLWLHGRTWVARSYGSAPEETMRVRPCLFGCGEVDGNAHGFVSCPVVQDLWKAAEEVARALLPPGRLSPLSYTVRQVVSAWAGEVETTARLRVHIWRTAVLATLADYRQNELRRARTDRSVAMLVIAPQKFTAAVAKQVYSILDAKLQQLGRQQLGSYKTAWLQGGGGLSRSWSRRTTLASVQDSNYVGYRRLYSGRERTKDAAQVSVQTS
ncbi:hypothetical protein V8E36_006506, partial [Tilletia maclaganii]